MWRVPTPRGKHVRDEALFSPSLSESRWREASRHSNKARRDLAATSVFVLLMILAALGALAVTLFFDVLMLKQKMRSVVRAASMQRAEAMRMYRQVAVRVSTVTTDVSTLRRELSEMRRMWGQQQQQQQQAHQMRLQMQESASRSLRAQQPVAVEEGSASSGDGVHAVQVAMPPLSQSTTAGVTADDEEQLKSSCQEPRELLAL